MASGVEQCKGEDRGGQYVTDGREGRARDRSFFSGGGTCRRWGEAEDHQPAESRIAFWK